MTPRADELAALVRMFEDCVELDRSAAELSTLEGKLRERLVQLQMDTRCFLAELSDEALALGVQQGFCYKLACDVLFERWTQPLLGAFLAWRVEWNTANDLVQKVLLKVYRNGLKSYDRSRPLFPYVMGMAHKELLTQQRRSHPTPASDLDNQSGPSDVVNEAVFRETVDMIRKALAQLADTKKAQAAELSFLQGKSRREIAEVLHVSKQTISTWLCDFRTQLALILAYKRPPDNRGRKRH
jgi:RNA polymerase sigma factor (sigma-70 family)